MIYGKVGIMEPSNTHTEYLRPKILGTGKIKKIEKNLGK